MTHSTIPVEKIVISSQKKKPPKNLYHNTKVPDTQIHFFVCTRNIPQRKYGFLLIYFSPSLTHPCCSINSGTESHKSFFLQH